MKQGQEQLDTNHFIEQLRKKDWYKSYAISASYVITDVDQIKTLLVTTGASTITVTLPTAAANLDRVLEIIKVDSGAGSITIDGEGSETINGRLTFSVHAQYHGLRLKCDGTNWYIDSWISPPRKTYYVGTSYNGVSLTVTGSGFTYTVTKGYCIPYQTIDGSWFLEINVIGSFASASSRIILVNGVSFDATASYYQPITCLEAAIGTWGRGHTYTASAANAIYMQWGANTTVGGVNGRVLLTGKPTWAD